jgi:hypothetical protein
VTDPRTDPDDLAGYEDLPPDDPRVLELGPRARASLRAYRDFMASGDAPEGAPVADAEAKLGEALERELGVTLGDDPGRAPPGTAPARGGRPRAGGFLDALLGPRLRPALAFAVLIVVAGGVWLFTSARRGGEAPAMRGGETPVMRGGETGAGDPLGAHVHSLGGGSMRLEWNPSAEASSYTVTFLSPDLVEVARMTDVRDTHVDLLRGSLPSGLTPGARLLWRVSAMRGADEVVRSRTTTVTVP